MPLTASEKTINGKKYCYAKQPLTPATELMSLVARVIEEPVSALASAIGGKFETLGDLDLGNGVAERIARAVLSQFGKSEVVLDLITRLNAGGSVKFKPQGAKTETIVQLDDSNIAEQWFQQHIGDLPAWIAFALEAQLGPFFGGMLSAFGLDAGKLSKLMELAAKSFGSPASSETTGQSSDSSSNG